jgi:polysaccharide biosynthesis protein VpsM
MYINIIMKRKWTLFLIIFLFLFLIQGILYAKEKDPARSSKKHTHKKLISQKKQYQLEQVAVFRNKKNAERLVRKLRNEGKEVVIRQGVTKDKKTIFRVFVKKLKVLPETGLFQSRGKHELALEETANEEENTAIKAFPKETPESSKYALPRGETKPIASFRIFDSIEDADKLASQQREDGYKVTIRSKAEKDDRVVYTVFAEKIADNPKVVIPPVEIVNEAASEKPFIEEKPSLKDDLYSEHKEKPVDALPAAPAKIEPETAVRKIPFERKPVEAESATILQSSALKDPTASGEIKRKTDDIQPSAEQPPIGTSKEKTSSDVFGKKGGYVHPFLSVTEFYTDNVFYSKNDKKSDFATVISPGIWFTVPGIYEKLLIADTSILSPGGFSLSRYKPETFKRYQTYLFYNADIELYSKEPSGNIVNHKLEGLLQYNLRGGLTFELIDQFLASHDLRGTGISQELDKYRTNMANFIVTYNAGERFMLRLDYANYFADYTAFRNGFRDRNDNTVSAYVFYRFRPKTSLFYEYEFVDVSYRDNVLSNSAEHHSFLGVQWDVTAKSKGSLKAGYGLKDFDRSGIKNINEFIFEAQVDHKFTTKTSLLLKASRKTNETNISTTDYMISDFIEAQYIQKLTGKITANAGLSFGRDAYGGELSYGGRTKNLKDDYITGMLAIQYKFKEWLEMDTGYLFGRRDSSFPEFDYTSNMLFLRITGSL